MPKWRVKIPEFNQILADESLTFEEKRDKIVDIVLEHPAFADYHGLTGNSAIDPDEFDDALEEIYDYADDNGIWLGIGFKGE